MKKTVLSIVVVILLTIICGCKPATQVEPHWIIKLNSWDTFNQILNFEPLSDESYYYWLGINVTIQNKTNCNQIIKWGTKDIVFYRSSTGFQYDWQENRVENVFAPYQSINGYIYIMIPRNDNINEGAIIFRMNNYSQEIIIEL